MLHHLTEEQRELRQLARRIAEEKVRPLAAACDHDARFPAELIPVFAEAGFYQSFIPEECGGMGVSVTNMCLITEELSRACGGIALAVAVNALGTFPILIAGSDEQKVLWLPDIAQGKKLVAFGLTEPEAGSDAGGMMTTAVEDGNHYVLNGVKHFITNAPVADLYSVFAMTNREAGVKGISAFVVEKGTPGFTFGKKEEKMGIRASCTSELVFQDCRVPKANLLGKLGMGFIYAMKTLDNSRPGVAAQAVGIAQGALDLTLDYVKERKQFGQAIADFQGIQWMLADMATEIEAARSLLYRTCALIDARERGVSKLSAMAKLKCSDVAMKVTTDCVQLFGGYGYMMDYPIEKYMRDAKITQIYEGTNQIQKVVIAANLLKGK